MDAITIPITSITADPALQPRTDGLDLDHVRALEMVAEAWPPLKVVGPGCRFLLVDGFHRFAAAQNLGLAEIAVEVLEAPADGDLHALAFTLNAAHGRPLTLSDRRAFAARLLRAHPDWSDREIGRRSGLVQPTIAKVRQDLEREKEIAPAVARTGRDGRVYPAKPRITEDNAGSPGLLATTVPNMPAASHAVPCAASADHRRAGTHDGWKRHCGQSRLLSAASSKRGCARSNPAKA
jgi:hypothetical protein